MCDVYSPGLFYLIIKTNQWNFYVYDERKVLSFVSNKHLKY